MEAKGSRGRESLETCQSQGPVGQGDSKWEQLARSPVLEQEQLLCPWKWE